MARKPSEDPQLDMTPMIDVVFELIIFFVITIKQQDIMSRLNANRPAPATASEHTKDDPPLEIEVGKAYGSFRKGVYVYNGKELKLDVLDKYLKDVADLSTDKQIVVKCTLDSPHKGLVDLLDVCYKHKLTNVSIFSM